eukprot:scaffold149622_cov20-Prasinocladus_malaysianus.AAC.1
MQKAVDVIESAAVLEFRAWPALNAKLELARRTSAALDAKLDAMRAPGADCSQASSTQRDKLREDL